MAVHALEAYARGRRLIGQEYVADGKFQSAIEKLFSDSKVDYLQVNSTTAGCFTFRIERAAVQQQPFGADGIANPGPGE